MNEEVKVSIIIPCYNYGKTIDRAVNSVLKQTYQNFEIIIVNDGSTDEKTNKKLANYTKPKTKVIHISNQGPSVARNTAIEAAKGKYILPLDADDEIDPTYLEKAVKILDEDDDVSIVCCDYRGIVDYVLFKRIFKTKIKYKFPECILYMANYMFLVTSFFRKADWEKVGGFNPNMVHGSEDHNFWLAIMKLGGKVYHIPEILTSYHRKRITKTRYSLMSLEQHKLSYIQTFHNHKQLYLDNIETMLRHTVDLTFDNFHYKPLTKKLIYLLILTYYFIFLFIIFEISKAIL